MKNWWIIKNVLGPRNNLRKQAHAKTEHKIRNRHPAMLALHFAADSLLALLFSLGAIMSGIGNRWMHTPPEPSSEMVNVALGYALFFLLFWGWTCRCQFSTAITGLPDESTSRHRLRLAILYGYKLLWIILTAEAAILTIRTTVWWWSWQ